MGNLIESFDGVVFDMDGVLYRGDKVIPGAPEAVGRLRDRGISLLFLTNNSAFTVPRYVEKLTSLGIAAESSEVLTSANVTADVVRGGYRTAFVVGGEGIREAISDSGIEVLGTETGEAAELVVVGWDRGFTYEKMRVACLAVQRGARFIATNSDATFPAPDGLWPGAGSILASIERASGAEAEVMGKPHEPMMRAAAARLQGCSAIAMIGDRADTDLAGAQRMGWSTILVLSGVTPPSGVDAIEPQPDHILASVADL